ncbi:terminase [Cellulomonas composti]|uniref:Terminase n=1 Tax=Cellulomonas composti TaxID=266130 RepID=A0A511JBJ8_9CELL|nr:terminase [Cellulomonas composti]GEL95365.1 hypothetical protein CCO02nite_20230 [Cellulomonas composti]
MRDQCADLGLTFDRWQDGAGRLILAQRVGGKFAAGIGGVHLSWPRQVGKTYLIGAIVIALCLLRPGMLALWTAHHGKTINETFRAMQAMVKRAKIAPHVLRVTTGNGDEGIEFRNGSRILFGAREHGFGLGFTKVTLIVFDEAQRLKSRTIVDMVPTTNAATNPLVFYIGTPPRPEDNGDVFAARRKKALAVAEARAEGVEPRYNALYIELGADPSASRDEIDWNQLAKANPSYPHRVNREAIERMWEQFEDKGDFRREGYGIWDDEGAASVIPWPAWTACRKDRSKKYPMLGPVVLAVEASTDRQDSAIAVVGGRKGTDLPQVTLAAPSRDSDTGTLPAGRRLVARVVEIVAARQDVAAVVVDEKSPCAPMIDDLRDRLEPLGVELVTVSTAADLAEACAQCFDAIVDGALIHWGDARLDASVRGAVQQPMGDAWKWSRRKGGAQVAPLIAVTLGLWEWKRQNASDYDVMDSIG